MEKIRAISIHVIVRERTRKGELALIVRSMESAIQHLLQAGYCPGVSVSISCEQLCREKCDRSRAAEVAPTCEKRIDVLPKDFACLTEDDKTEPSVSIHYMLPADPDRTLLRAEEDGLVCIVRPGRRIPKHLLVESLLEMARLPKPYLVEIYPEPSGKRKEIRSDDPKPARRRICGLKKKSKKPRIVIARHLPKK